MKKLLLSCFVALGFAATAQVTTTNLAVTMLTPTANSNFTPGVAVPISLEITNNGSANLTTSDSLIVSFYINNNVLNNANGQPLLVLVRQNIAVNASYTFNINLTFSSFAQGATVNFCSAVLHRSAVDTDTSNNIGCASVNLIQGTVSTNDEFVNVLQDASFYANGNLNMNISGLGRNELVNVEVTTITGQVVLSQTVQANDGMIKTELPVNAATGVMIYRITNSIGELISTEKFMAK
jgi:hypothetical protein